MKKFISCTCIFLINSLSALQPTTVSTDQGLHPLVSSAVKINLKEYPQAWNPSLIEYKEGYLMTFRETPNPLLNVSYIGIVLLDDSFQPISQPQLLSTHIDNKKVPSQAEDARLFSYKDSLYILFNDNPNLLNPSIRQRRDLYLAKLSCDEGNQFSLSKPTKLFYPPKHYSQIWQKNWVPFEWNGALLFSYTLNPHEVLYLCDDAGNCTQLVESSFQNSKWKWGEMRGGTPALLVDNDYLAFFHSAQVMTSEASKGAPLLHYFMGAYTFSSDPPFDIKMISPEPIIGKEFYTDVPYPRRVIFPTGFVVKEDEIIIAYGKNDREMWIARINKTRLYQHLVPIDFYIVD